jgi:hypothetical protein
MGDRGRWGGLSPGRRRLLVVMGVAEGILKIVALVDLKRQPASQVRGRKWNWAAVIATVSSAGLVPLSYFVVGRRRQDG